MSSSSQGVNVKREWRVKASISAQEIGLGPKPPAARRRSRL
jgi:hypothetical protein